MVFVKLFVREYTLGDNNGTVVMTSGEETPVSPVTGLVIELAEERNNFYSNGTGAIDGNIYVSDSGKVEDKTIMVVMEDIRLSKNIRR